MARVDTQQTNFRLINHFMAKNGDVMTRQVKRQLERLRDKAAGVRKVNKVKRNG